MHISQSEAAGQELYGSASESVITMKEEGVDLPWYMKR